MPNKPTRNVVLRTEVPANWYTFRDYENGVPQFTLMEFVDRVDPRQQERRETDLLNRQNEILADMKWKKA